MNKLQKCLIYSRDFFVSNWMVYPKALIYKNRIIYFTGVYILLYFIIIIFPFCFISYLLKLFNIDIIYKLDSIYHTSFNELFHIIPIIFNFSFDDNDFTLKIKYYTSNIPIKFIIDEYNLHSYKQIKVKYFMNSKILDKTLDIDNYIDSRIYNIFEIPVIKIK